MNGMALIKNKTFIRRIILSGICFLFLATAFMSDSPPPGWYQQTLPVNKQISDIWFADSLNGWAVTSGGSTNDSGYILNTINGGTNWNVQLATEKNINAIQFIDRNLGYAVGGFGTGRFFKTTNGGINWSMSTESGMLLILDLAFINKDTGWICGDDSFAGGVYKTTNGGNNWFQQLNNTYLPSKIIFINKDTGWAVCNSFDLYKTTNSGLNWFQIFHLSNIIVDIQFINNQTGWITNTGSSMVKKTTNGGLNWFDTNGSIGGRSIFFIDSSKGWLCDIFSTIQKSTDGGINWYLQSAPSGAYYSIFFIDSLRGWAGGSNKMVATQDGGGPVVSVYNEGSEVPQAFILEQNFPNPFNPSTKIKFSILKSCTIELRVFDITGKEIAKPVSGQEYNSGEYTIDFNAVNYSISSGIYFYTMRGETTDHKEIFIDTKKMVMIK